MSEKSCNFALAKVKTIKTDNYGSCKTINVQRGC